VEIVAKKVLSKDLIEKIDEIVSNVIDKLSKLVESALKLSLDSSTVHNSLLKLVFNYDFDKYGNNMDWFSPTLDLISREIREKQKEYTQKIASKSECMQEAGEQQVDTDVKKCLMIHRSSDNMFVGYFEPLMTTKAQGFNVSPKFVYGVSFVPVIKLETAASTHARICSACGRFCM
jgi:hypothetical protein